MMKRLTIQKVLDQLSSFYANDSSVVSVQHERVRLKDKFSVTYSGQDRRSKSAKHNVKISGKTRAITIELRRGEEVLPDIDKARNRLNRRRRTIPIMGGDPVWHNKLRGYGTLGIAVKGLSISYEGRRCGFSGNSIISNNHVIAQKNSAAKGDQLCNTDIGCGAMVLHCFFPIKVADVAVGEIKDSTNVSMWMVRGVSSRVTKISTPKINQGIKKSGARTGLTSGKFKGWANIHYEGVFLRGVCQESLNFTNSGDSGSIILDSKNRMIGIHFAGQNVKGGRVGFFLAFSGGKSRGPSDLSIELEK